MRISPLGGNYTWSKERGANGCPFFISRKHGASGGMLTMPMCLLCGGCQLDNRVAIIVLKNKTPINNVPAADQDECAAKGIFDLHGVVGDTHLSCHGELRDAQ